MLKPTPLSEFEGNSPSWRRRWALHHWGLMWKKCGDQDEQDPESCSGQAPASHTRLVPSAALGLCVVIPRTEAPETAAHKSFPVLFQPIHGHTPALLLFSQDSVTHESREHLRLALDRSGGSSQRLADTPDPRPGQFALEPENPLPYKMQTEPGDSHRHCIWYQ